LIAAMMALTVLALPAQAQDLGGRVLMDVTLRVAPGAADGHCLRLDAGMLDVSVQYVDGKPDSPITSPKFALGPYRTSPARPGSPPEIEGISVTAARTTATLPVVGGLYCYSISTQSTPEIDALPSREWAMYFQYVALRMVLTPQ